MRHLHITSRRLNDHVFQVFYNLGELDDALHYALASGPLFDVSEKSEYVQTILGELLQWRCHACVCYRSLHASANRPHGASLACHLDAARCIDLYIEQRVAAAEGKADAPAIDDHLTAIVERMFERCQHFTRLWARASLGWCDVRRCPCAHVYGRALYMRSSALIVAIVMKTGASPTASSSRPLASRWSRGGWTSWRRRCGGRPTPRPPWIMRCRSASAWSGYAALLGLIMQHCLVLVLEGTLSMVPCHTFDCVLQVCQRLVINREFRQQVRHGVAWCQRWWQ